MEDQLMPTEKGMKAIASLKLECDDLSLSHAEFMDRVPEAFLFALGIECGLVKRLGYGGQYV